MNKQLKLTEEELMALQATKLASMAMGLKSETAAVESGRALAEDKVAELEYENTLLRIYLNYGLTGKYIVNETTGKIQLKKEENDNEDQSDTNAKSQID